MVGVVVMGITIVVLGVASVLFTLWNAGEQLPARLRRRPPGGG
jgi:hypothetical protein